MSLAVRLFGPPEMRVGAGWEPLPLDKRGALLAVLAHAGAPVPRPRLARLFWPEGEETAARTNLRGLLARLRALRLPAPPAALDDAVAWPVEADTAGFANAVAACEWLRAVDLCRGVFLDDFDLPGAPGFAAWLDLERARLSDVYRRAVEHASTQLASRGDGAGAVALLAGLLDRDPLDERAVAAALELAARAPEVADPALGLYERLRRRLEDEVGLPPEERTAALAEAVKGRRSGLVAVVGPPGSTRPAWLARTS
jgi:DNA-binding SARP family transcriptional activator